MKPYWENAGSPRRASGTYAWDLGGFALGLMIAWAGGWRTTDLIWSLWFASLVVGTAVVAWDLLMRRGWRDQWQRYVFLLGFFLLHFTLAHLLHAFALMQWFPISEGSKLDGATMVNVASRYWLFLPAAFLAERAQFKFERREAVSDVASKIAEAGGGVFRPYGNVVRLHILIVLTACAHLTELEYFSVYALIYTIYFFPWRALSGDDPTDEETARPKRRS